MFSFLLGCIWKAFTWTVELVATCTIEAILF